MSYTNAFSTPYMGGVWEAANLWNGDFIAVKWDGRITEFEIKVSLADLRGEVAAIREALKPGTIHEQTNMFGTRKLVRAEVKLSHTKYRSITTISWSTKPQTCVRQPRFCFTRTSSILLYRPS